jgi:nucleotide-binding universal stress UspA family protein
VILLCYDGTVEARRAIDESLKLLGPRRALVIYVGPRMTPAESLAALDSVVPGDAFEDSNRRTAFETADHGTAYARRVGFDAEPRAELGGSAGEIIANVADEIDAEVIVVGSRGLSGAKEFVKGSVSHDVAAHARRPVLIVPPPRDA